MKITIKHINSICSVSLPGSSQLGYVADFETPLVKGTATVVPSAGKNETLVAGRSIDVDIKQEHISKFQALEDRALEIRALEDDASFAVKGKVIYSYGDSGDFGVEVGSFIFALNLDESLGRAPAVDDWVSFEAHGVSLWQRD